MVVITLTEAAALTEMIALTEAAALYGSGFLLWNSRSSPI
ncbi:hypothetical protein CBFG_03850 [Clostridiales bacterium 1_7_47FAA]|nr:hypothetical protein CBFG_03850 [Clostridiales bacterium 1_7_47FAA]